MRLAIAAGMACNAEEDRAAEASELQANGTRVVRLALAADSSLRQFLPNTNHGGDVRLHVGRNGLNWDRSVLAVDAVALQGAIGTMHLVAAELELDIEAQSSTWTVGGKLAAHRLTVPFKERNVTWNCAEDTSPANFSLECATGNRWMLGASGAHPYDEAPTAVTALRSGASGTVLLDVTADVQRFLTTPADNRGWLLKLVDDPATDWVNFYARTGSRPPALVLTLVGDCDTALGTCGPVVRWEGPGGAELPELADPIAGPDSFRMADTFDWTATRALPVTTPEGFPTIFYALFYLEARDQADFLDQYQVHWDALPLFAAERTLWAGQRGLIPLQGDGNGIFVFGLVPGAVYNAMRASALGGEVPFTAVILRPFPAGVAIYADGSIRYDVLRAEGFDWRDGAPPPPALAAAISAGADGQNRRIGRFFRKAIKTVTDAGRAAVDGVRRGVGELSQLVRGDAALNLSLLPTNTDPSFKEDVQRRGWGKGRGTALALEGVPVRINQGTLGFKLHKGRTNAAGFARIIVAKNQSTDVCFDLENDAAIVTSFIFPRRICDFSGSTFARSDVKSSVARTILVKEPDVASFSVVTDGNRYARQVMGRQLHKARLLSGKLASLVTGLSKRGGGAGAIAPCIGLSGDAFEELAAELAAASGAAIGAGALLDLVTGMPGLGSLAGGVGTLGGASLLFTASVIGPDIILDKVPKRSRGVPAHEYGHFAMCSLMKSASASQMSAAYMQVIIDRVTNTEDPHAQAGYVAEAWAELFASQVVGGVNYFHPVKSRFDRPSTTCTRDPFEDGCSVMSYCPAGETGCMDNNLGGSPLGSFPPAADPDGVLTDSVTRQIARVATTLHDMVDGGATVATADVPGNATAWINGGWAKGTSWTFARIDADATRTASPQLFQRSFQADEGIALSGAGLGRLFERWAAQPGSALSERSLFTAMADAMKAEGATDTAICELFALHASTGTCPGYLPVAQNLTPPPVQGLSAYLYATDPLRPDPQGRRGRWRWISDAPSATGFELVLRDRSAGTTLDTVTRTFRRDLEEIYVRADLPYNSEVELAVTTANGLRKSPTMTYVLATPAEAVSNLRIGPVSAGRSTVCFTETRATYYDLEVRDGVGSTFRAAHRFTDGAGNGERCHELFALPATVHTVRVVALNRHGQPALPSPEVTFTPLALRDVYVSAARGSDTGANLGQPATPFKTLGAAVAMIQAERARIIPADLLCTGSGCPTIRLRGYDGVSIRLAVGAYTLPTAYRERGADFITQFSGGLAETTWAQTSARSVIQATPAMVSTQGCVVPRTLAMFSAESQGAIVFDHVEAAIPAPPSGDGVFATASVAYAQGGTLELRASWFFVDGVAPGGSMSAPVSTGGPASGGEVRSGPISTVRILDSKLTSRTGAAAAVPGTLVGLCGRSLIQLAIERSDISATESTLPATVSGAGSLIAVLASNAGDVVVGRSQLRVAANSPSVRLTGGSQAALIGADVQSVLVHNTLLRTGNGGKQLIVAGFTAAPDGVIELVQNTLVAGNDFAFAGNGPSDIGGGVVLALSGTPAVVNLANNLLSFAAGKRDDAVLIDRSGLRADPRRSVIRGNVWSMPFAQSSRAALMRCSATDYRWNYAPNVASEHACFRTTSVQTFDVSGNSMQPDGGCELTANPAACFAELDDVSMAYSSRTLTLDDAGAPRILESAPVQCNGDPLDWFARKPDVTVDLRGLDRGRPFAGFDDDCDGVSDESGERAWMWSAGAIHGRCTCDARIGPLI